MLILASGSNKHKIKYNIIKSKSPGEIRGFFI